MSVVYNSIEINLDTFPLYSDPIFNGQSVQVRLIQIEYSMGSLYRSGYHYMCAKMCAKMGGYVTTTRKVHAVEDWNKCKR